MALLLWTAVGWLGAVVASAAASRLHWGHWVADVPLVVVAFLAMRHGVLRAGPVAILLGLAVDGLATAPTGLHATGLVAAAATTALVGNRLGGTGALHFGLVAATAQLAYHVALVVLLAGQHWRIGFVSWPSALLLPAAVATAVLAACCYRPLLGLDRSTRPRHRKAAKWR